MHGVWPPTFLNPTKRLDIWHIFGILVDVNFIVIIKIPCINHLIELIRIHMNTAVGFNQINYKCWFIFPHH